MDDLSAPTGREPELVAVPREDGSAPLALVFGATGYIGGRLVPRLLAAGYRVRVLARDLSRVAAFTWGSAVEGDRGRCHRSATPSRERCADVDVLYYLVHSMAAGKGFEDTDRDAAENVAQAAAAAAVGRIVYLGGLHPDRVSLSPHLRSRVEVGEVFLGRACPTLVLQAGVVIGSGSASFEMVRHLTDVLPYMPAPRWVRNRIQPIAVRDVLHYLLGAARVAPDVNRAVDIGGPDVLRYGQMMNGYAVEAGLRQRPIAALPVLTPAARIALGESRDADPAIHRPTAGRVAAERVRHEGPRHRRAHPASGRRAHAVPARGRARTRTRAATTRSRRAGWTAEVLGVPSDPLPSDPDWAGRTVFVDTRTATTPASPDAAVAGHRGDRRRERVVLVAACSGRSAAGWTGSSAGSGSRAAAAAVRGSKSATRSTSGASRRSNAGRSCVCAPR